MHANEEPRRNQLFFGFPKGGRIKLIFFVTSERTMHFTLHQFAPRVSKISLIRSAKMTPILYRDPVIHIIKKYY